MNNSSFTTATAAAKAIMSAPMRFNRRTDAAAAAHRAFMADGYTDAEARVLAGTIVEVLLEGAAA